MKITDILTEEITDREKLQQLAQRQPDLANRMMPWIQQGIDFDVAAERAKQEMQQQRDRKDSRGRKLKHDRYYSSNPNLGKQAASGARDTVKQLSRTDGMKPSDTANLIKDKLGAAGKAMRKHGHARLRRAGIPDINIPFTGESSEKDK